MNVLEIQCIISFVLVFQLLLSLSDRPERKGYRRVHQLEKTLHLWQCNQTETWTDRKRHKPEHSSEEVA